MRVFSVGLRSSFHPWAKARPLKGPRSRWTRIPWYLEHRQALGENYSLLIMGDHNVDGDGGEVDGDDGGGDGVDGDGSGGTSPSRQAAGTETSVPQNWSSMAGVLQNFSRRNADSFRVFTLETFIG
jgi:hypothetical protein